MKSSTTVRAVALTSASKQIVSQLRDALNATTTLDAATTLAGSTILVSSTHVRCLTYTSWPRFAFALSQPSWSYPKPIALDLHRPFTTAPSTHTQAASAHAASHGSTVRNRPETASGFPRSSHPTPRAPGKRHESPSQTPNPAPAGGGNRSGSESEIRIDHYQRHQQQQPASRDGSSGGSGQVGEQQPHSRRSPSRLPPSLYGVLCEQLDAVRNWEQLDRLLRTTPHEMWHGNQLVAAIAAFTRLARPATAHRPTATQQPTTTTVPADGAAPASTSTSASTAASTSAFTAASTSASTCTPLSPAASTSAAPEKITSYLRALLVDWAPYLSLLHIKDVLHFLSSFPHRSHPLLLAPTADTTTHSAQRWSPHSTAHAMSSRNGPRDTAAAGFTGCSRTTHSSLTPAETQGGEEAVAVLPLVLTRLQALVEGGGFAAPTIGTMSATDDASNSDHVGSSSSSGGGNGRSGEKDKATGKNWLRVSFLVQMCSSLVRLQQPSLSLARAIAGAATPLLSRGLEGEGLATVMLSLKEHTNVDPVFSHSALRAAAASTSKLTNPYSAATLLIAAGRCGDLGNQDLCALASRLAELIESQRRKHRHWGSRKGGGRAGEAPKEGLNSVQIARLLQSCITLGFKHSELLRAIRSDIEYQRDRLSVPKRLQLAQLLLSLGEDTLAIKDCSTTAWLPQSPPSPQQQPGSPPAPPPPSPPPGPSTATAPDEPAATAAANDAVPRLHDTAHDGAGSATAASSVGHQEPEGSSSTAGRMSEAGIGTGAAVRSGTTGQQQYQRPQTEAAVAVVGLEARRAEEFVAEVEGQPPLVTEAEVQTFLRRTDLSLWNLLNILHSLSRLRDPLEAGGMKPTGLEQLADIQPVDISSPTTTSATGASSADVTSHRSGGGSCWHVRMPSALTSALLLVDAAAPMMTASQVLHALNSVTAGGAMVPPSLLLRAQDLYEQPPAVGSWRPESVGCTDGAVEGGLGTEGGEEIGSSEAGAWTRTRAMVALCESVGRVLAWQPDAAATAQLQDSFARHCRSAAMRAGRHG